MAGRYASIKTGTAAHRTTRPKRSTKIKKTVTKKVTPTYTARHVRAALPDAKAEVVYELPNNIFTGTVDEIKHNLLSLAKEKGLKNIFTVERRTFTSGGSRYHRNSRTSFALVGFRPYTDSELEAEGPKLVKKENARRLREYKAELKKVQAFNKLAVGLGQPLMNEPTQPELLTL